ncbi:hypothetical protein HYH03_015921 [Edaphochlamys debaryana]|uniref:Guanylate cyclase domain-containing protein n=1 Tax=Edaphochlamys debaryana TaxID=47281 RepID=A0A835XKZ5_9CHLO|nr:hypothetical protein HYH03_015921 [Edaphochlamys debaryana]|eukprot:KAG2485340.1 hypothetical protein HYH03_015921 [Edaphochlamys debaryana]
MALIVTVQPALGYVPSPGPRFPQPIPAPALSISHKPLRQPSTPASLLFQEQLSPARLGFVCLEGLPVIVTAFAADSGAVLHQNTASVAYFGQRAGEPGTPRGRSTGQQQRGCYAHGGALGAGAAQPSVAPDPGAGSCPEDALRALFALDPSKLDLMMTELLAPEAEAGEGVWEGIVRVPASLNPAGPVSSCLHSERLPLLRAPGSAAQVPAVPPTPDISSLRPAEAAWEARPTPTLLCYGPKAHPQPTGPAAGVQPLADSDSAAGAAAFLPPASPGPLLAPEAVRVFWPSAPGPDRPVSPAALQSPGFGGSQLPSPALRACPVSSDLDATPGPDSGLEAGGIRCVIEDHLMPCPASAVPVRPRKAAVQSPGDSGRGSGPDGPSSGPRVNLRGLIKSLPRGLGRSLRLGLSGPPALAEPGASGDLVVAAAGPGNLSAEGLMEADGSPAAEAHRKTTPGTPQSGVTSPGPSGPTPQARASSARSQVLLASFRAASPTSRREGPGQASPAPHATDHSSGGFAASSSVMSSAGLGGRAVFRQATSPLDLGTPHPEEGQGQGQGQGEVQGEGEGDVPLQGRAVTPATAALVAAAAGPDAASAGAAPVSAGASAGVRSRSTSHAQVSSRGMRSAARRFISADPLATSTFSVMFETLAGPGPGPAGPGLGPGLQPSPTTRSTANGYAAASGGGAGTVTATSARVPRDLVALEAAGASAPGPAIGALGPESSRGGASPSGPTEPDSHTARAGGGAQGLPPWLLRTVSGAAPRLDSPPACAGEPGRLPGPELRPVGSGPRAQGAWAQAGPSGPQAQPIAAADAEASTTSHAPPTLPLAAAEGPARAASRTPTRRALHVHHMYDDARDHGSRDPGLGTGGAVRHAAGSTVLIASAAAARAGRGQEPGPVSQAGAGAGLSVQRSAVSSTTGFGVGAGAGSATAALMRAPSRVMRFAGSLRNAPGRASTRAAASITIGGGRSLFGGGSIFGRISGSLGNRSSKGDRRSSTDVPPQRGDDDEEDAQDGKGAAALTAPSNTAGARMPDAPLQPRVASMPAPAAGGAERRVAFAEASVRQGRTEHALVSSSGGGDTSGGSDAARGGGDDAAAGGQGPHCLRPAASASTASRLTGTRGNGGEAACQAPTKDRTGTPSLLGLSRGPGRDGAGPARDGAPNPVVLGDRASTATRGSPEPGGSSLAWHEVRAAAVTDPDSGARYLVVMQKDVTAKVEAERHIAQVSEAEHRLLEQIFPRHVLAYMTEEGFVLEREEATADQAPAGQSLASLAAWRPYVRDCTRLATWHPQVTVLFADIQGFTPMCKQLPPAVVMKFLNDLFVGFDSQLDVYGVYKVETIGDCYVVAGGLITEDADGMAAVQGGGESDPHQADRVFAFGQAMLRAASRVLMPTTGEPVKIRVGIHSGPVVSGVVGTRMPRFCLFGDTINTASRMESTSQPGCVHVSSDTYSLLTSKHEGWAPTGGIEVKGKGLMETHLWTPPSRAQLLP